MTHTHSLILIGPTRTVEKIFFLVSVIKCFYGVRGLALPFDLPGGGGGEGEPDGITLRVIKARKLPHHDKAVVQGEKILHRDVLIKLHNHLILGHLRCISSLWFYIFEETNMRYFEFV